ncbi:hypothetical protein KSS87_018612 [Heliosperma pusillum]|nr:hypothetical protein KSS87_018612 [Heliosperma pusillum]
MSGNRGIVIQCGYCRLEHFAVKRTDIFCCSRCRSLIPIQTHEEQSRTTIVSNRSVKSSPLPKVNNSSENPCNNGSFRRTSGSSGVKYLAFERPKASFSMFNACPRVLCEARLGKRALICGVSYKKQKYKLKGTFTDVYNIKHLLMYKYHFPEHVIRVLTEEDDLDRIPTKANIEAGLGWLVEGCRPGDSLVFYFSGHGLRQPDFDDDEIDGFDETLCPVDFKTKGMIFDNDLNDMIVKPLIKGVTLHAIIDACHSGTILDLEYLYSLKERKWLDNRPPSGVQKCTSGGRAVCFSACRDDEMATDSNVSSILTYIVYVFHFSPDTINDNCKHMIFVEHCL